MDGPLNEAMQGIPRPLNSELELSTHVGEELPAAIAEDFVTYTPHMMRFWAWDPRSGRNLQGCQRTPRAEKPNNPIERGRCTIQTPGASCQYAQEIPNIHSQFSTDFVLSICFVKLPNRAAVMCLALRCSVSFLLNDRNDQDDELIQNTRPTVATGMRCLDTGAHCRPYWGDRTNFTKGRRSSGVPFPVKGVGWGANHLYKRRDMVQGRPGRVHIRTY